MNTYHEVQLDALGDATRRAILARLLTGPLAVGELARDFPVSRPAISQHLRLLKQANLAPSTSEALRLVDGGGVRVDGSVVSDRGLKLAAGTYVVQVGKRKFARVTISA